MSACLRSILLGLLLTLPDGAVAREKPPLVFASVDTEALSLVSALVLQEAYATLGERFVLHLYPNSRALPAAEAGWVDGDLHRIAGIETGFPHLLQVPVAHNRVEPTVILHHPGPALRSWQELAGRRIGILRGVVLFEERTAGLNVTREENLEQLLNMLEHDRLDVVVDDRLDALVSLRRQPHPALRQGTTLETMPLYHYLNRRHADLLPKIAAALTRMQQQGRLQAIRDDIAGRLQRGEPLPAFPVKVEHGDRPPN